MRPEPGDPLTIRMTKWGDRPHWVFDGAYLGADDLGDWVGFPAGTPHDRPGLHYVSEADAVTLVPRGGGVDAAWLATRYAPGFRVDTYVDVATPAVWADDGRGVTSVDLDLDVVRRPDGSVYVDDEDEFAEHRASLGYPSEVVDLAVASCAAVLASVTAGLPPYDDATVSGWLSRLAVLSERDDRDRR